VHLDPDRLAHVEAAVDVAAEQHEAGEGREDAGGDNPRVALPGATARPAHCLAVVHNHGRSLQTDVLTRSLYGEQLFVSSREESGSQSR
jgi:hypothetical protein